MNIAIFTPSQNPYSETFIQAHKTFLKGRVFYYYGKENYIKLEGGEIKKSILKEFILKKTAKLFGGNSRYMWSRRVLKSIKQNKIDVILVEYGTHANHLLPVLEKIKLPIVVHFHGYDASRKSAVQESNNYASVFKLAKYVISVSRVMHEKLLGLGCSEEKLIYNVYGPEPSFETVTPMFSKRQFLAVGRFTDKKAPYYTIMAFAKVVEKYKDAKLLLAGNGVLLNVCKNLVKQFKIEDNVKFIGVITPKEYRELLSESIALVQHSIIADDGDMEGTPLAILEASSSGLPVISTNHAGIPDVITHNETGLLCDEHDVELMAHHMLKLVGNIKLAKELGDNGKQRIKEHFSLSRHIDKLQKLLED